MQYYFVMQFYFITGTRSVFCRMRYLSIAAKAVTLHLLMAAVNGHLDIYYAEKVAQYAQNPEVKGLTHEDIEILRNKCIEVTTLTFQGHVTSSVT